MKRFQALKELDTQIEQRSHTRKKVKGSRPPITRFVYSSESEYVTLVLRLVLFFRAKEMISLSNLNVGKIPVPLMILRREVSHLT